MAILAFALNAAKAIPGNGGKPFVLLGSPYVESKHTPFLPTIAIYLCHLCVCIIGRVYREG